MQLTKKFKAQACKETNSLAVWSAQCQQDFMLMTMFARAANEEHCAHVVPFYRSKFADTFKWQMEAINALRELGLYHG